MKIDIASPMVAAFHDGADTYAPICNGEELEVECGSAKITLRNLSKIINPNRRVVSFMLAHGQVLIVFNTGESYLATGFGYGHEQEEAHQFALFASKHGFGNHEDLFKHISGIPDNIVGPLPPLPKNYPGILVE